MSLGTSQGAPPSTAGSTDDSENIWDHLGDAWRSAIDGLKDAWRWSVEHVGDWVQKVGDFLHNNPGPAFTLLGALIALSTAWLVHYDRVRRESNERIRRLLGEYVAAVEAQQAARMTVEKRKDFRARNSGVMEAVDQLKGKAPSPASQALNARVSDAQEEEQRARNRVGSLLFQLSIAQGKRQNELVFTARLLAAAETDVEYANAYNFALSVGIHLFGDTRRERKREKTEFLRKHAVALQDWNRHVAKRDAEIDVPGAEERTAETEPGDL